MFKIKEDVDLKKLEKFGFEENIFGDYSKYLVDTPCKLDVITDDRKTRQIRREIKEINTIQVICKRVATVKTIIIVSFGNKTVSCHHISLHT